MAKNFWFKFYFKDWSDDVKPLSLNARGLLIELIIHLNKTGGVMECSISDISRLTGGLTEEITGGLSEFRRHGTFDFEKIGDVEFIKSRKILKQVELQATNTKNGLKGGNPKLKRLTDSDNPRDNREDNPTPNSIFNSYSTTVFNHNAEFGKQIVDSSEKMLDITRTFRNNKIKSDQESIKSLLKIFIAEISAKDQRKESVSELQSHFVSWAKINAKGSAQSKSMVGL